MISAYGEPDEEDGEDLRYYYTNSDGLDIAVEISIVNEKVYMAAFALADSNWGSVTNAQECVEFINAALETSFYGKFDTYVEGKFDTEEGAQALYESEVEYYAQGLMYYLDIDSETVDGGSQTVSAMCPGQFSQSLSGMIRLLTWQTVQPGEVSRSPCTRRTFWTSSRSLCWL